MLAALLLTASALVVAWLWRQSRARRRQAAVRRLLDHADELERLLQRLRVRMRSVQGVVDRVPADIGAAAHASLDRSDLIRSALRDLLQHRLWIQRCGDSASDAEMDRACRALGQAKDTLGGELRRLERASEALARAADAASAEAIDVETGRRG